MGRRYQGGPPEVAPDVSARGADDFDMGDEVAQRGASDAESVVGDEQRGDSSVLVMHDGVTKSIFCSFDSRERS